MAHSSALPVGALVGRAAWDPDARWAMAAIHNASSRQLHSSRGACWELRVASWGCRAPSLCLWISRRILASANPQSLVLLDEVGSGTDPKEGSALAVALLEALADRCALTLATTHQELVKEVADRDPRFVNASVEFDIESLRPTYRLSWGQAGASNALNVAQALGFDPAVVREARAVLGGMSNAVQSADVLLEDLTAELATIQARSKEAARRASAPAVSLETHAKRRRVALQAARICGGRAGGGPGHTQGAPGRAVGAAAAGEGQVLQWRQAAVIPCRLRAD